VKELTFSLNYYVYPRPDCNKAVATAATAAVNDHLHNWWRRNVNTLFFLFCDAYQ